MNTTKGNTKLYIFDSDGTLYDDKSAAIQFDNLCAIYVGDIIKLPQEKVAEAINFAKQKHKTNSTTIACLKEFGLIYENFVLETYLKIKIDDIFLNSKLVSYLNESGVDRAVFTGSPELFAKKIISHLGIEKYFKTIIGMEKINFQDKKRIDTFKLVSKMLPTDSYKEVFFWDDRKESRDLGSILGWVPMIP